LRLRSLSVFSRDHPDLRIDQVGGSTIPGLSDGFLAHFDAGTRRRVQPKRPEDARFRARLGLRSNTHCTRRGAGTRSLRAAARPIKWPTFMGAARMRSIRYVENQGLAGLPGAFRPGRGRQVGRVMERKFRQEIRPLVWLPGLPAERPAGSPGRTCLS